MKNENVCLSEAAFCAVTAKCMTQNEAPGKTLCVIFMEIFPQVFLLFIQWG